MKFILLFFSVFLIGTIFAASPGVDLNNPIQAGGGGGVEIVVENETLPIDFSKKDIKCITGCVNEILDKRFIMTDEGVSGEAYTIIDMLKGMNFGLTEELEDCQAKLDKTNINKYVTIFSVVIAFLLIIWKTFDIANARRSK